MIINKKGSSPFGMIAITLFLCLFMGLWQHELTENKRINKNREDMVAQYSVDKLYKNKFSEIKPLSTKEYVVKVENSDVENEKYVKVRFSADNFKEEDVYVIQKRDNDNFEIVRKTTTKKEG